ncbi:MAG TPA: phosphoribosylamine--glycine ligase [Spirochaetia bacterium]|nr:phosphoribosylamine--glycine ligase [Spirochaetia bacterium]
MNILILGSGGREHAIAVKLSENKNHRIFICPGNGGTALEFSNIRLPLTEPFTELIKWCHANSIDLAVPGPEALLMSGVVDYLTSAGIKCFGPFKNAALVEGSKAFAKEIMLSAGVPTAGYNVFTAKNPALQYLKQLEPPYVLKADGLAQGKGVIIAADRTEAENSLAVFFDQKKFGSAGEKLVIEEFLIGQEVSILAFTDGREVRLLPASQDHKRIGDNDQGPNTGGMGVYSPVKIINRKHFEFIEKKILKPFLKELERRGIIYRGILYAGLMINKDNINVVEFNARFGDPETECVLPLLKTDLAEIMCACANGSLDKISMQTEKLASCTVILASGGYPEEYKKGMEITGLDKIHSAMVYHAGTKLENGKPVTDGGRVLAITACGADLKSAIKTAYENVKKIHFNGMYYRTDIGKKGL